MAKNKIRFFGYFSIKIDIKDKVNFPKPIFILNEKYYWYFPDKENTSKNKLVLVDKEYVNNIVELNSNLVICNEWPVITKEHYILLMFNEFYSLGTLDQVIDDLDKNNMWNLIAERDTFGNLSNLLINKLRVVDFFNKFTKELSYTQKKELIVKIINSSNLFNASEFWAETILRKKDFESINGDFFSFLEESDITEIVSQIDNEKLKPYVKLSLLEWITDQNLDLALSCFEKKEIEDRKIDFIIEEFLEYG